jgi:trans-aconitate methyltransferase
VERQDTVWKSDALVRTFLEGVRGGVPFGAEQIEVMLRVVAARGTDVKRFADLGCGSGVLAKALLTRYPGALGILVDFSQPMLEAARRELGGQTPAPRFVAADLADPGWLDSLPDDAPLDVVVSGYAIHHLTHARKQQLYAEIFARLAPVGMFINVEHVASRSAWVEAMFDDLTIDSLHAFHAKLGSGKTRREIADEFVHRPDKAANILAPVELQCDWLRSCGYEDVDCYFKVFELAVFGGRKPGAS